jgi:RNA polymerase sigma-70 factor (ECF subfamily)
MDAAVLERAAQPDHRPAAPPHVPPEVARTTAGGRRGTDRLADPGPDPSRTNDSREAYERLAAALQRLPARQREAFTLRVLEELDVETTAKVMGCSDGSVKTHLSRARDALSKQLEDFR